MKFFKNDANAAGDLTATADNALAGLPIELQIADNKVQVTVVEQIKTVIVYVRGAVSGDLESTFADMRAHLQKMGYFLQVIN